jgi:hypothetical protein
VGKRERKTPRTPEKQQQAIDNWFPGSGVPPAPEISLPRPFAPPDTTFRKATIDQIKREIVLQEELVAAVLRNFPRLTTGTRSELISTEEEAEKRMEAHERIIQEAKLELLYRGENPPTSSVLPESEGAQEEKRITLESGAQAVEPTSSVSVKIAATATSREWYDSDPDTLRRRQAVLKNSRMAAKRLCNVFDHLLPPLPLLRDWSTELSVKTWSEAYANPTGRKRIQKIISTDKRAKKKSVRP